MSLSAQIVIQRGPLHVDVSFEVQQGEVLAILGPNGAGKSTLLRILAGLTRPQSGRIVLDGQLLDDPTAGVRVPPHRRPIGMVFQDHLLFPHLSTVDNVAFGLRARGQSREAARRVAAEWVARMNLSDHGSAKPRSLSGGQAQRIALARALAGKPRLLLLDEPLSSLDRALRERLASQLSDILRRTGTTALYVTHDHDEAFAVADQLAVMRAGRIVQQGEIADVWRAPVDAGTALFLGYATVLDDEAAAGLLARSIAAGHRVAAFGRAASDLEELFLQVTAPDPWPAVTDTVETMAHSAVEG